MPIKTTPSPLHPAFQRLLREMQASQLARRRQIHREHELDELQALSRLAYNLWGVKGFVWIYPESPGIKHLGYYLDGRPAKEKPTGRIQPGVGRPHTIVFSGATHAEIWEQVRAAKNSTVA